MNRDIYNNNIKGFLITDAAIINARKMVFALKGDLHTEPDKSFDEAPFRLVSYIPDNEKLVGGYGKAHWDAGYKFIYTTITDRIFLCGGWFDVWESKADGSFYTLSDNNEFARGCSGISNVGEEVYVFGGLRKVFRRNAYKQWEDLTDETKHPYLYKDIKAWKKKHDSLVWMPIGFAALDGFNPNDLYAGGEEGDMWRYDGNHWHRVDLPGSLTIKTITCGGDGQVYVAGSNQHIMVGREDNWETLEAKSGDYAYATHFNSSAWFQDKLYLATEMNLFVWDGKNFKAYEFPEDGPQQYSFKNVTASDEALLSYGHHQALVFDGTSWQEIVGNPVLSNDG